MPETDTASAGFGRFIRLKQLVRQDVLRNSRTAVQDLNHRLPLISIAGYFYV
jgi:hypothetical protein